jgi:hypothetical protein
MRLYAFSSIQGKLYFLAKTLNVSCQFLESLFLPYQKPNIKFPNWLLLNLRKSTKLYSFQNLTASLIKLIVSDFLRLDFLLSFNGSEALDSSSNSSSSAWVLLISYSLTSGWWATFWIWPCFIMRRIRLPKILGFGPSCTWVYKTLSYWLFKKLSSYESE